MFSVSSVRSVIRPRLISEVRAQVIETVAKLPDKELMLLKKCGEYLLWRSQREASIPKGKSPTAQHILEFMEQSRKLSHKDIEALMQCIVEGKLAVRYDSRLTHAVFQSERVWID